MTDSVIERIQKNQFELKVSESITVNVIVNVLKKSSNTLTHNEDFDQFLYFYIDDKELLCPRSNR